MLFVLKHYITNISTFINCTQTDIMFINLLKNPLHFSILSPTSNLRKTNSRPMTLHLRYLAKGLAILLMKYIFYANFRSHSDLGTYNQDVCKLKLTCLWHTYKRFLLFPFKGYRGDIITSFVEWSIVMEFHAKVKNFSFMLWVGGEILSAKRKALWCYI